jgi:hypothetical protein
VSQHATPRDIDEFADQIPDKYLACRVDSHSRVPSSIGLIADMNLDASFSELKRVGTFMKTLRCRNKCGITWQQVVDSNGAILWESGPRYTGAPGYLTKGMGRFTKEYRNRLRLEQLQRAIENGKGS